MVLLLEFIRWGMRVGGPVGWAEGLQQTSSLNPIIENSTGFQATWPGSLKFRSGSLALTLLTPTPIAKHRNTGKG